MSADATRQAVIALEELWRLLLPEASQPEPYQWRLWLALHDEPTLRRALEKLAIKFRSLSGKMETDHRVKFVSAVANKLQGQGRYGH